MQHPKENKTTEVLTEKEATAATHMTPSMLKRVQAERVWGNVSKKKRVFLETQKLSPFSVFHTDLSGTRSALCGAKCLNEEIRYHSARSYKLCPRYCVCVCGVHYLFLSPFLFRSSFGSFPIWRNNDTKHADCLFKITSVFFHGSVTL